MSAGLPESQKLLYRPVNQNQEQVGPSVVANASSSLPVVILCVLCGAVTFWFYLSGKHILQDYREMSYRRDMRRRHGIPDHDTRPFDIAVKDVAKRMAQEEAERIQQESRRQKPKEISRPSNSAHDKENIWPASDQVTPCPVKRLQFQNGNSSSEFISQAQPMTKASSPGSKHPEIRVADVPESHIADNPAPPGALLLPDPYALALYSSSAVSPSNTHRMGKGVKRSVSNVDEYYVAPARKRQAKGMESDHSSVDTSTRDTEEGAEDAEMANHSGSENNYADSEDATSEHSLRGKKRHRDSETNTEVGERSGKREPQKRRLDSRRPTSLVLRGKKRDRSDQGSVMGDGVPQRSRKREKLYDQYGDIEMLEDIRESDVEEDETGPPESQLSTPTDNLTDELPFSTDPLCQGRRIGEEWTINRQRFKVGYDGRRLRHALVKRLRRKYNMPEDSVHPDAIQQIQVLVETWLTEEEYKEARDRQELAWQDGSLLARRQPLSTSPMSSAFGERSLSWSIRSPVISPFKREFNQHIIPNPFLESPKPVVGRRLVYSMGPSNSPNRPQMHLRRACSQMDKEEMEAAAMAKLRAAREAKLAAEKAETAKEAEKEKEKEKARSTVGTEAKPAQNAKTDSESTPTATGEESVTASSGGPKISSLPLTISTPPLGPQSTNFLTEFSSDPKLESSAESTISTVSTSAVPPKLLVPSFNFTVPFPKSPTQESTRPKQADASTSSTPQATPKSTLSFTSKSSTPSFNFSTPALQNGNALKVDGARLNMQGSKPTISLSSKSHSPAFNSSSTPAVPQVSDPSKMESTPPASHYPGPTSSSKPTAPISNFSFAAAGPQSSDTTKDSTAPSTREAKPPTPAPTFSFTQPKSLKPTTTVPAFSFLQTTSQKPTSSILTFSSSQSQSESQNIAKPTTETPTPTPLSLFSFSNPSSFGNKLASEMKSAATDEGKDPEANNSGNPAKPSSFSGFNFSSSLNASPFKDTIGTSAFPSVTPANTPQASSNSPLFGTPSTNTFGFGTNSSGQKKGPVSQSRTPEEIPSQTTNTTNARFDSNAPKENSLFGRAIRGLPNSSGTSVEPSASKHPISFNFGQSSIPITSSGTSQTARTARAPSFSLNSNIAKEAESASLTSGPQFSFGAKPSEKQN